jgi:hypothetical protein
LTRPSGKETSDYRFQLTAQGCPQPPSAAKASQGHEVLHPIALVTSFSCT